MWGTDAKYGIPVGMKAAYCAVLAANSTELATAFRSLTGGR